jgi:hypothetical protein
MTATEEQPDDRKNPPIVVTECRRANGAKPADGPPSDEDILAGNFECVNYERYLRALASRKQRCRRFHRPTRHSSAGPSAVTIPSCL